MRKILFISFLTCLLLTANGFANTGASFLKIGIGARSIGLGSAFTAVANDVTAIHWNPAGLAQLSQNQLSAMHSEWLVDTSLDFVGFAIPMKSVNSGVIGGSLLYLNHGKLEGRDINRNVTQTFGASDLAVNMSYSKVFSRTTNLGVNLKIIRQQIEREQASGIALDIGGLYKTSIRNLSIGIAVQNIGPQMKFISEGYNLPLTVTCGVGYDIGGLTVAMDIKNQVYEGRTIVSIGTEYLPVSRIAMRAGYLSQSFGTTDNYLNNKTNRLTNLSGLSMGIGLKILGIQTDYSFVPYGELGNTHRMSFTSKF